MKKHAWLWFAWLVALPAAVWAQPSLWASRGPGGGGALFAPTLSPHELNEAFVSCDMSGLYRSTDMGCSWSVVPFGQIVASGQGCQVQFTSNPKILYALDYAGDSSAPAKSTDGGATWTRLPSDPTDGGAYAILADPARTDRVLVTDYSNLYFSGDGGASWNLRYSTASGNGCYIAGGLFDGDHIYLGTNLGVLASTNGGGTFTVASLGGIPASQALVSFAGAKEGSAIRFVGVTLGSGDVYPGVTGSDHDNYQGVYVLDWGQANWVSRVSGIAAGDHPFFAGMALGETDVMYVAGGSDAGVPVVYKSIDGGQSWTAVFETADNQNIYTGWSGYQGDRDWGYGEYALGFAVSPSDPGRAILTDLGFAHVTTDGGANWHQAYVLPSGENPPGSPTPKGRHYKGVGLENTSCWGLTWSDANNVFASFTDIRGARSQDGGKTWGFDYTGHTLNTMYHCVRHSNGTLYAATSSVHDLYETSSYLGDGRIDAGSGLLLFSTDSGATWQTLHNFGHPVAWVALDPTNASRMYASVPHSTQGGIFVSSDIQKGASSTWAKLANPPRTQGHPYTIRVLSDGTVVCTYSGRIDGTGAFTNSSGLFVMLSGQTTWLDRSDPNMDYWTKDVVIDPTDSSQNTWYVCVFSNWGSGSAHDLGGLYKTTNRGLSWARIFPSVAQDGLRVESCAVNPSDSSELYLTTETAGLWRTGNLSASSPTFTQVTSYPFEHPLRVFFNAYAASELWVTSFGYGMAVGLLGSSRAQEVSRDGAHALRGTKSGSNVNIVFQDTAAAHYNLYVSNSPVTHPLRAYSSLAGKKQCALTGLTSAGGGMLQLTGYGLEAGITGATGLLFFLVSGDGGAYAEGPLGYDSLGEEITADAFCSR